MNGPEHYREAERLLRQAKALSDGDLGSFTGEVMHQVVTMLQSRAEVHATLALAAATAARRSSRQDGDQEISTAAGWHDVIRPQPQGLNR